MTHDVSKIVIHKELYEAMKHLPAELRLKIYLAVLDYQFEGIVPTNLDGEAEGIFEGYISNLEIKKRRRKPKSPMTSSSGASLSDNNFLN